MTRQEYEAKLADLQSQIEELKQTEIEEDSPKPPHPRWMPEEDELYYTILGYGEICGWIHHNIDDNEGAIRRSSIDNVFRTEAEAEFAVERLKVLAEMREWAGKWDDPYALVYSHLLSPGNKIQVVERYGVYFHLGEMRFASRADAKRCVDAVGAGRIAKYYFSVPS